jgi:hypothetical protein
VDKTGKSLIEKDEVVELTRLYLTPEAKQNPELKNLASFVISRGNRMVKNDAPKLKVIITRADSGVGHTGAIYQATNAIYAGVSKDRWRVSDKEDDSFVYRKSQLKKYGFDDWSAALKDARDNPNSKLSLKKMSGKHFYMYIVDEKNKDAILKGMKKTIQPYPKKSEVMENIISKVLGEGFDDDIRNLTKRRDVLDYEIEKIRLKKAETNLKTQEENLKTIQSTKGDDVDAKIQVDNARKDVDSAKKRLAAANVRRSA